MEELHHPKAATAVRAWLTQLPSGLVVQEVLGPQTENWRDWMLETDDVNGV